MIWAYPRKYALDSLLSQSRHHHQIILGKGATMINQTEGGGVGAAEVVLFISDSWSLTERVRATPAHINL